MDETTPVAALGFSDFVLNRLRNIKITKLGDLESFPIEDYFWAPVIFPEVAIAEVVMKLLELKKPLPSKLREEKEWREFADEHKGTDFSLHWKGKCWHCGKTEVPGDLKVCETCWDAIHNIMEVPWSFDWCSECEMPGEPLCDACFVSVSFDEKQRLKQTRRVPDRVLRRFSVSENDRHLAHAVVGKALEKSWVHWGNVDKVKSEEMKPCIWAGLMFDRKFPRYETLRESWSLQEVDPESDGVKTAWIWFAVLFFVPFGVIVGALLVWAANNKRDRAFQAGYSPNEFHLARLAFEEEIARLTTFYSDKEIDALLTKASGDSPDDWREGVGGLWQPLAPLPNIPERDIDPLEAEEYVASLMLYLGLVGTRTTRRSRDGGVDVRSDLMLAQVKHQLAPVGVKVVREIHGVAASEAKRASVFARFGFTADAISFGEKTGVFLFSYSPVLKAHTVESEKALKEGFPAILGA